MSADFIIFFPGLSSEGGVMVVTTTRQLPPSFDLPCSWGRSGLSYFSSFMLSGVLHGGGVSLVRSLCFSFCWCCCCCYKMVHFGGTPIPFGMWPRFFFRLCFCVYRGRGVEASTSALFFLNRSIILRVVFFLSLSACFPLTY